MALPRLSPRAGLLKPGLVRWSGRSAGLGAVPEDFVKMKLAPGFMVGLNVLDDPDFSGTFRIDEQGNIALPILGTVHIAGETISEARTQIKKKLLDDQILQDPQVEITVLEYTESEVTHHWRSGQPQANIRCFLRTNWWMCWRLRGELRRLRAIKFRLREEFRVANQFWFTIPKPPIQRLLIDVIVHPGDTVQVKRAGIVYVLGAVNRPGGFVMQEEGTLNVLQAISLADGTGVLASIKENLFTAPNPMGRLYMSHCPIKRWLREKALTCNCMPRIYCIVPTSTFKLVYSDLQTVINSAATSSIYLAELH